MKHKVIWLVVKLICEKPGRERAAGYFVRSLLLLVALVTCGLAYGQSKVPVPHQRPNSPIASSNETNAQKPPQKDDNEAAAFETCISSLRDRGVEFLRQQPFENEVGCRIGDPVKIISVTRGSSLIALKAQPQLSCQFALRLATWLLDVSTPVSEDFSKSPLVSVTSGPGFVCRHRYNDNVKKISEHAFGNAIDLTGFNFANGESIAVSAVLDDSLEEKRMLAAQRLSSCGYFTPQFWDPAPTRRTGVICISIMASMAVPGTTEFANKQS